MRYKHEPTIEDSEVDVLGLGLGGPSRHFERPPEKIPMFLYIYIYLNISSDLICLQFTANIKRLPATNSMSHNLNMRTLIVPPSIKHPRQRRNNQDDSKSDNSVVHRGAIDRESRGEEKKDGSDDSVGDAQQITEPAERLAEIEGPVGGQLGAAAEAVDGGGDGVGDAEGDDGGGEDGVEGDGGAEEDEAEDDDEDGGEDEGVEGDAERGDDAREEAREGEAAVTREGVCHSARGGHDGDAGHEEADKGKAGKGNKFEG